MMRAAPPPLGFSLGLGQAGGWEGEHGPWNPPTTNLDAAVTSRQAGTFAMEWHTHLLQDEEKLNG